MPLLGPNRRRRASSANRPRDFGVMWTLRIEMLAIPLFILGILLLAVGAAGAVCAAFTALLTQHRTLVGVPFALHAKPRAKRSEIKSHKMQIQPQLHTALRTEGLTIRNPKGGNRFTPQTLVRHSRRARDACRRTALVELGFFRRPMLASRNQADALGINSAATNWQDIGSQGFLAGRL